MSKERKSLALAGREAQSAAGILTKQQATVVEAPVAPVLSNAELPVDAIHWRVGRDTRTLRPDHVLDLAESIASIGCVQSVAVDRHHRLIGGGHRLAAIRLLNATPERKLAIFSDICEAAVEILSEERRQTRLDRLRALPLRRCGVPVTILDIDAEVQTKEALKAEIAENEKRINYTAADLRRIIERLEAAGYAHIAGRPKSGEKPIIPELALIIGKSARRVQQILYHTARPKRGRTAASAANPDLAGPLASARRALADLTELVQTNQLAPDVVAAIQGLVLPDLRRIAASA